MLIRWCAWHKPKWLGFMGFRWGGGQWGVSHGICGRCYKEFKEADSQDYPPGTNAGNPGLP